MSYPVLYDCPVCSDRCFEVRQDPKTGKWYARRCLSCWDRKAAQRSDKFAKDQESIRAQREHEEAAALGNATPARGLERDL